MDEEQLRLLSMYKDISAILNSYHIRFYMGYGTALGTVRHNGFIPWDNDIDLLVWESDLPMVRKAFKEGLDSEKYYYHEPQADTHPHIILKVKNFEEGLKNKTAQFIDIFPLVKYPDRMFRKVLFFFPMGVLQTIITVTDRLNSYPLYKCARRVLPFLKRISGAMCNEDTKNVTVLSTTFYKEASPITYFEEPILRKFEDADAPLPKEYDKILKNFYGNYMVLPPECKRQGASGYPCCAYFDYMEEQKSKGH